MLKPGSLMGGGAEKAPVSLGEQEKNLHLQAALCLSCGQHSEAFLMLSQLAAQKPHPAALFNLAICYFKAGVHVEAQRHLEKALAALQPLPDKPEPKEGPFKALAALEAEDRSYAGAMPLELAVWPQLAKVRIMRLLVDVYVASGQWREVLRLAQALGGGKYANVEEAVAQARAREGS